MSMKAKTPKKKSWAQSVNYDYMRSNAQEVVDRYILQNSGWIQV